MKKYKILEDIAIADIAIEAYGKNLDELFENTALAIFEESANLNFRGIQAYHGLAQHIRKYEERRHAVDLAITLTKDTVALLTSKDISCEVISGAGTGSFEFEGTSGVYNELQPGSYVFMDADYAKNKMVDGEAFNTFRQSLFVNSTILSVSENDHIVLDAGLKSHSVDSGMPTIVGCDNVIFTDVGDEHGVLDTRKTNRLFRVNENVLLIPGHCDPTVNLHNWYVGLREGRVECLWPISARGPSL